MQSSGLIAGHTFTDWLCLLMTEKDYVYSILQATAERNIENLKLYFQAVGDCIDTVLISTTDYGTQKGEMINPQIFKELYLPHMKRVNDFVHSQGRIKTMYHTCGSVRKLIEYFIQGGADILNPLQVNTANMDPRELKQEFGGRIVFWGGGVDTQTTYQFGTAEEVRQQAVSAWMSLLRAEAMFSVRPTTPSMVCPQQTSSPWPTRSSNTVATESPHPDVGTGRS